MTTPLLLSCRNYPRHSFRSCERSNLASWSIVAHCACSARGTATESSGRGSFGSPSAPLSTSLMQVTLLRVRRCRFRQRPLSQPSRPAISFDGLTTICIMTLSRLVPATCRFGIHLQPVSEWTALRALIRERFHGRVSVDPIPVPYAFYGQFNLPAVRVKFDFDEAPDLVELNHEANPLLARITKYGVALNALAAA